MCDAFIHEIYYAFLIDSIRFRDIWKWRRERLRWQFIISRKKNQIVSVCQFTHIVFSRYYFRRRRDTVAHQRLFFFLPARWHVLKTNKSVLRFMDSKNGGKKRNRTKKTETSSTTSWLSARCITVRSVGRLLHSHQISHTRSKDKTFAIK